MENGNIENAGSDYCRPVPRDPMTRNRLQSQNKHLQDKLLNCRALLARVLNIPDGYHILVLDTENEPDFSIASFLNGSKNVRAGYLDSGQRSAAAIKNARFHLEVEIIGSSRESAYSYIPGMDWIPQTISFLHVTSTNEQQGNTIARYPEVCTPLVCDMSYDLFLSGMDIRSFDLVYVNGGNPFIPEGLCLVIIKDSFLNGPASKILDCGRLLSEHSNFSGSGLKRILVACNRLGSLERAGGVTGKKMQLGEYAKVLYREIDRNRRLHAPVMPADRSNLAVRFSVSEPAERLRFASLLDAQNISCVSWSPQNDFLVIMHSFEESEMIPLIEMMRAYESSL